MIHGERSVSWKFKIWESYTKEDKLGLAKHLRGMNKQKRIEYIKYLDYFCGAPLPRLMEYVKGLEE